jgi:hypothetical protein
MSARHPETKCSFGVRPVYAGVSAHASLMTTGRAAERVATTTHLCQSGFVRCTRLAVQRVEVLAQSQQARLVGLRIEQHGGSGHALRR